MHRTAHLLAVLAAFSAASAPLHAVTPDSSPMTVSALISQGARIAQHRQTNRLAFLGSPSGTTLSIPGAGPSQSATESAMAALDAYGPLFGLQDPAAEMTVMKLGATENGRSIVRYQQHYRGVPIIGGELNVNLAPGNGLLSINGEISPRLSLSTQPGIDAQQAMDTALSAVAKWQQAMPYTLEVSPPVLSIYDPQLLGTGTGPASLVWRMEVISRELKPIRELVLVDAQRDHVSLHFNQIDTVKNRETYTSGETSTLPGTLVCNEADPTCTAGAGDTDAVNAHQFAGDTYDFYSTTHSRDSINNAGMTIISSVHWTDGISCPNAFWNGTQMVYCTGLVADDVVAHELTHGVTQNTSNLFYYYQSGAINESFSDVWGEFVDLSNTGGTDNPANRWEIGEDVAAYFGGTPLRSMKDPTLYGDPDKMTSLNYWTSSGDNGGVHTNSGVNNKAVYLMVDGDTFNGTTVTGLGIAKVAKIYYEVQTHLLTSGADYLDLYNTLYQGCQNLIGTAGITSGDCNQVRAATNAVEMNQEPVSGFNPEAAICPAGTVLTGTTVFFDDIESGLGKWTRSGSGWNWAGLNATYGVSYATSGIESLLGEGVSIVSDQRAAITVALPAHPYLHFNHAFDFEFPNYDGGVMEYSTNGGVSWVDAGTLIDAGKSYSGTIATGFGNPLSGRTAFVGPSHGYVSTRLNLGPLAGQSIQLRWRVGTDNLGYGLGWVLDDVRVYACDSHGSLAFTTTAFSQSETGNAVITVTRSGGSGGAVTVDYLVTAGTATEGSDFTATAGTLSWSDTDGATKSFTIPLINDTTQENAETVSLTLTNPTGGATIGSPGSATLTITDDDSTSSGGGGGGGCTLNPRASFDPTLPLLLLASGFYLLRRRERRGPAADHPSHVQRRN